MVFKFQATLLEHFFFISSHWKKRKTRHHVNPLTPTKTQMFFFEKKMKINRFSLLVFLHCKLKSKKTRKKSQVMQHQTQIKRITLKKCLLEVPIKWCGFKTFMLLKQNQQRKKVEKVQGKIWMRKSFEIH